MRALRWVIPAGITTAAVVAFAAPGSSEHPVRSAATDSRDAACQSSPTKPGIRPNGRPAPGRLLGEGPILAGTLRTSRARLDVVHDGDHFGNKLFYLLKPDGPARYRVSATSLEGHGVARFEVHRTDSKGRLVRAFVPVLRIDRARTLREFRRRRGDVWIGQPGSIRLPALGCYELRVRWAGGGWTRNFNARLDPRVRGLAR